MVKHYQGEWRSEERIILAFEFTILTKFLTRFFAILDDHMDK